MVVELEEYDWLCEEYEVFIKDFNECEIELEIK